MFKDWLKNYVHPVAVFSGGMIGVGFLSLPYIAEKTGIWVMAVYFLVLTSLIIAINLMFCQISLKTPDFKRLPGFVDYHLGKWAKIVMMLSIVLGILGVLLIYLIIGGQFLNSALGPIFSGNLLTYVLIYFSIASVIVYFDIKVIKNAELWILLFLFLSLLLVFVEGFSKIKLSNIFIPDFKLQLSNLFLPYGAILFSLWGVGLIPEVEEMLVGRKILLKKVVTISTIIVSIFYFLFVLLIMGITGSQTGESALPELKNFLPPSVVFISLIAGVAATIGAFITQAIILKKTLMFDLKIKHWHAFVITCFIPLIFLLLGLDSFIPLVSLVGGVLAGVDGILILMVYRKIGGKSIFIFPLFLVFILGTIYEVIYFIK